MHGAKNNLQPTYSFQAGKPMIPGIISAEPYTGTLSPLHQTIAERRGIAHLHNEEMEKKYGRSPDGYHNWQDEDGYNREYPLPYSFRYFYRFIDLFCRFGAESGIIDALEQDFIGDEADAFYIETLFVKAEKLGVFTPGAAITLYADSHVALFKCWLPGVTVNASWATSDNTYSCGKGNNACRKLIRKWLKEKSKEDKPLSSQPHNLPAEETEAGVSAFLSGDEAIARCNVAAFMSGPLNDGLKIALCDKAALKIGLVISGPITDKADDRSKIHALAYGLHAAHKAEGAMAAFRVELAKRYSVDYSKCFDPQHYPGRDSPNKKWDGRVTDVMKACR